MDFDDDDRDSNYEEVESDVDIEELSTWLNTNHSVQSGLLPREQLVRKYLPPVTVQDLYEHYKSTQSMLCAGSVS